MPRLWRGLHIRSALLRARSVPKMVVAPLLPQFERQLPSLSKSAPGSAQCRDRVRVLPFPRLEHLRFIADTRYRSGVWLPVAAIAQRLASGPGGGDEFLQLGVVDDRRPVAERKHPLNG